MTQPVLYYVDDAPVGDRWLLGIHNRALEAARNAKPADLVNHMRPLLSALESERLQSELAAAASAFAEGTEESPYAEAWITFAVSARAVLEQAMRTSVPGLARALDQVDAELDDLREAVLLLEPEDYLDALGSVRPNPRRWWGERARLDEGVREIDLERALGEL